ncbi:PTS system IIA component (Glc family) [Melghirimyces profundicolus]|uniref:PTS system IIA component (Glc family) n=1 Tax=Melghirimyces profundicolus TaxID=1242148 RepID=A0A2T6BCG1_9BACL|nr:PTS glucose transporter subunit IIA [Melghirimyces profundicolus]PTX53751.1 PTS system IIA component (Glc family) [Melghirimyces profundicolus]
MLKKLFGKKERILTVQAPLKGKVMPLSEVPDPVFSDKMMGDGVAIEPGEAVVRAPVDGEIIQLFHTKHAVGIRTEEGLEVLIHIGLETVSMEGEGFTAKVKEGDRVRAGQPLIEFSLDAVQEKAKSTITPIVITNMDKVESLEPKVSEEAEPGDPVMEVKVKS